MNPTTNTSATTNNVIQLVQNSVRTPFATIFDKVCQQMSAVGRPTGNSGGTTTPEAIKPRPAPGKPAAPVDGDTAQKAGIDFSLASLKEEKKAEKLETVRLDTLSGKAIGLFQQQLDTLQRSFSQALNKQFRTAVAPPLKKKLGQHAEGDQTLDNLSLVSNDELELQIILAQAESALLDANQDQLTLLCMRFEHVLKHETLATRLPVGPIAVGRSFLEAITPLDIDLNEKKLILLALLSVLKNSYGSILEQANRLLIQHNILPKLTEEDSRVRRKKDETRALAQEKRQKLLGISDDKAGDTVAVSSEVAKFIAQIKIPEGAEQHFVKGKADAPIISTKELASKIDLIKSVPKKAADNNVYFEPDTSGKTLAELLNSEAKLSEVGLASEKSNTIGIMSMLFENLLDNEDLPGPIKALLQQLRTPLLKAAIQDEMFFGDTENPAQKFFNDIAKASLTWTPSNNPETDILYKKMSSLVGKINNDFEDDYLIFDDAMEDLSSFTETETKKTSRIEGRIVDTEVAQARHKTAKEISIEHIDQKFSQAGLPADIMNFFNITWQQVLFYIFNKTNSVTSEEWLDAIEVENSLIANLSGADEDDIDIFLDILKEKLVEAGIQQFDIKKQLAVIRKVMLEKNNVQPEVVEKIQNIKPEASSKIINPQQALADDEEAQNILKSLHIGTWILKVNVSPQIKIKVAAHIKFNDTYVMVFRNGAKENTYTSADLVKKFKSKEFRILENKLVFDSALESVIGDIRD